MSDLAANLPDLIETFSTTRGVTAMQSYKLMT